MHTLSIFSLWRRVSVLVLVVGLGGGGDLSLCAQPAGAPPKQPQVARCYVKKTFFNLPLNMSAQTRANISEIHLFWLNNANGKWKMLAKCPPNQSGFDFDSQGEGEFWFTLSMVDMQKHVVPESPELSEYKMAVVVDMTPPVVDAQYLSFNKDGYIVQVEVKDANADPRKTVAEYQLMNKEWRALAPIEPESNRYCIPKEAAITGVVRVTAADLAENAASKEFDLTPLKAATKELRTALMSENSNIPDSKIILLEQQQSTPAPVQPAVQVQYAPSQPPVPNRMPASYTFPTQQPANTTIVAPAGPAPLPTGPNQPAKTTCVQHPRTDGFRPPASMPIMEDVSERVSSPTGSAICAKERVPAAINPSTPPRKIEAPGHDGEGILKRINATSSGDSTEEIRTAGGTGKGDPMQTTSASSPVSQAPTPPPAPQRKLINQRQVKLDYRLEHVGASGVGKVEVWITADQSQSWQKLCEDVERKSPLTVEMPGEGRFGISIVASNGRGFGGAPPNPGEAPDTWIEVDMTRPIVEIKDIRTGGAEDPGTVHVTWNSRDRNLAPDAVDLYFATSREGNWAPIAKGLRNDGHYRWAPPTNIGSQVYIRLVSHDLAGNMTVVETAQPFSVDDMSRPRGRLIGIVPVTVDSLEAVDR